MQTLTRSEELKIYTATPHRELEQKLIPIIQSVNTLSQYADLLKMFFGFYSPLENRLTDTVDIEKLTAGMQLRKADSLKSDIIAVQSHTDNLLLCEDLPTAKNLSSAFGIMYVLEGSILGGKAIATMLRKNLGINAVIPFSFFLHYGDEAKKMWDQFKARLDSTEGLSKSDLQSSAKDTFILFKTWIDKKSGILTP